MSAAPLESLPTRVRPEPADPTDATERLTDYALDAGLLETVLAALTVEELERCQGSLVVHADGRVECLEGAGCPSDAAIHPGTVSCAEAFAHCC